MKKPTIVVTGATGLLGSALVREWAPRYGLIALSHARRIEWPGVTSFAAGLEDESGIDKILRHAAPDLIVHAAAWTDVDGCERNPERAMAINSAATGRIAAAAAKLGSSFLYVSTDSVFDGARGGYSETDTADPVNVYSASKLAGEKKALTSHPGALVVRVSLEGWRPSGRPGFVQWVVEGLTRGERLTICTDWIRSVAFAANVGPVLEEMWSKALAGIYHLAPSRPISNFDLARMTARVFGLSADGLGPISGDSLELSARRPKDTSLDNRKLLSAIASRVWDIEDGVAALRAERDSGVLDQVRQAIREQHHEAVHDVR